MIVLKMTLVGQTHHAENARHGSLAGGQNGPDQKNLRRAPDTLIKERTKGKDDERQLRWQGWHKTFYRLSVLHTQPACVRSVFLSQGADRCVCQKWWSRGVTRWFRCGLSVCRPFRLPVPH